MSLPQLRGIPALDLAKRAREHLAAERLRQQQPQNGGGDDDAREALTADALWLRAQALGNPPRDAFSAEEAAEALRLAVRAEIDASMLAINEHDRLMAATPDFDPRAVTLWDRASRVESESKLTAQKLMQEAVRRCAAAAESAPTLNVHDAVKEIERQALDEATALYRAATKVCPEIEDPALAAKFLIPLRADNVPVRTVRLLRPDPDRPPAPAPADAVEAPAANGGAARHFLRVVHLSDTHNEMYEVPPCDVLVHSGDALDTATPAEVARFNYWMRTHACKRARVFILVAGNHCSGTLMSDEGAPVLFHGLKFETAVEAQRSRIDLLQHSAEVGECVFVLLHDATVSIGGVRFGGTPHMTMGPWGTMSNADARFAHFEALLRSDTCGAGGGGGADVLITHIPPAGIRDAAGPMPIGCHALLKSFTSVPNHRVVLHLFGHAHGGFGVSEMALVDLPPPPQPPVAPAAESAAASKATAAPLPGTSYRKRADVFKLVPCGGGGLPPPPRTITFSNAAMNAERSACPLVYDLMFV